MNCTECNKEISEFEIYRKYYCSERCEKKDDFRHHIKEALESINKAVMITVEIGDESEILLVKALISLKKILKEVK